MQVCEYAGLQGWFIIYSPTRPLAHSPTRPLSTYHLPLAHVQTYNHRP